MSNQCPLRLLRYHRSDYSVFTFCFREFLGVLLLQTVKWILEKRYTFSKKSDGLPVPASPGSTLLPSASLRLASLHLGSLHLDWHLIRRIPMQILLWMKRCCWGLHRISLKTMVESTQRRILLILQTYEIGTKQWSDWLPRGYSGPRP